MAKLLTRGPNSRIPNHRKAGYSAIYVIYAKTGGKNIWYYNNNNKITPFCLHFSNAACSYCITTAATDKSRDRQQPMLLHCCPVGTWCLNKMCKVFGGLD